MSKIIKTKSFKRSDYVTERKSGGTNKKEKKSGSRKRGNGRGTVECTKNKLNPYMIGGIKTSNGINRMVPIHPKIKDLIEFRYQQATELYHSEFLLNIPYGSSYKPFTYDTYEGCFHNVMDALNLVGYTPHCTRHTPRKIYRFFAKFPYAKFSHRKNE